MNKLFPPYLKKKYTKATIDEGIFMVPGVLSKIIFTKEYYENNPDLKEFTKNILSQDYRDYLFKNRNALYARVLRDILKADDEKQLILINNILEFINNFSEEKKSSPKKIKNKDLKKEQKSDIKSWSNIINPKE
ncbi:hypothetical protein Y136_14990 [Listeria monocytogenes]|nr:hypothetical protein [Listeria monocytogenes]EAD8889210.1 hypothetical protein [Listeria monocytogenes]EAE0903866.1 hypothetical protein [Listeria monocytogenes]EAF1191449.1 hypothetical protein [Listeria monocytogenes]EHC2202426.1 hypothetical protein [Listeria monocytogenes]